MSKTITVRPSDAILNALNELAAKENRSINYLVNEALRQYLKIDDNKPLESAKPPQPALSISNEQTSGKKAVNKESIEQQVERIRLEKLAKRSAMPSAEAAQPIEPMHIDVSELNNTEAF